MAAEHVAEALSFRSPTELSGVSDLALAAFAAATDSHVVREPNEARFRRFERAFDESAYRAELEACGYRFLGRSAECFPRLVRELHDPPPGLFLRGAAAERAARRTVRRDRRRSVVLVVRPAGRQAAGA